MIFDNVSVAVKVIARSVSTLKRKNRGGAGSCG